mmetsp:Transcript_36572/g.67018  ORF Transcript_36572/g.67018 Transcript_36572/m.67018 type:complete len:173 (-) Transcript_36572:87-605(-)
MSGPDSVAVVVSAPGVTLEETLEDGCFFYLVEEWLNEALPEYSDEGCHAWVITSEVHDGRITIPYIVEADDWIECVHLNHFEQPICISISPKFDLLILALSGQSYDIQGKCVFDRVGTVKEELCDYIAIPTDRMCLIFGEKVLDNGFPLKDYGILEYAEIQLVINAPEDSGA